MVTWFLGSTFVYWFIFILFYFYRFLIYLLAYLFIQLFNFKNSTFLQGNLLLEFKESGTFLEGFGGEFEVGKIAFELEDLKKDKEKRREKIGDFAFFREI